MKPTIHPESEIASANISKLIQGLQEQGDWRGGMLAQVRQLIQAADPEVHEEWKWVKETSPGTPVWAHDGDICTGEIYKQAVKLTFFRGASLADPQGLFTQPGTVRRAIDLHEGQKINEGAFKQLIRAAVQANSAALAERAARKK